MIQTVHPTKRLSVLLIFACCGVLMTAGCGERRSEQHRLEGDAYLKLHKLNEAADAYHKAEVANPNNALARVGLGRCYLLQQQYDQALAEFRKACELDPGLEPAYVDAANTLLKTNRPEDAIKVAQQFAAASPERGGVLQGAILIRAGRASDAAKLLTGLRDQFPQSADIRVSLATALVATQQPDKAEQELKTVLDALDPKSISARMLLADSYKAQGKTDASLAELRKVSEDNPDDPAIELALARGLANSGRTDEAQNLAQEVLLKDSGSGWANYVIGCCLMDKKQYGEAVPYLQAAEQALPGQPDVSHRLAAARAGGEPTAPGTPLSAPDSLSSHDKLWPGETVAVEDWQALWRQACLLTLLRQRDKLLEKGDQDLRETLLVAALVTRSFPMVEPIAKGLPESSLLRGIADVMKNGKPEEILKQFEGWNEQDPQRQVLRENVLGVALAGMGARTRAFQVLAKCYQSWPDNAVSLYNIAQMFQEANMSEFAASTLQRLIGQYPKNADAYVLLSAMLRDGGMSREARNAAEAAYSLFPNARDIVLSLCQAYIDTKDLDAAKRVLERALQTSPDDAMLKLEWAVLLMQSGSPEEAVKALETFSVPAHLEGRAALVRAFGAALRGEWTKVPDLVGNPDPAALSPTLQLLLAAADVNASRTEDALKALSAKDTSRLALSSRVREIGLKALGGSPGVLSDSEKELADALAKDPVALGDYLFGGACKAAQLNGPALETFKKLDANIGYHPQLLQSIFSALTRVQLAARAKEEAQAIAQEHAASPIAWVGLAMVMRSLDDTEGERQALAKAMEVGPNEPEAWFQQGQFCERQKDMKGATDAYRRLAELRPEDATANNNVAYCLLVTGGDLKEALERAQKAKEKLPMNPAVLHTLGVAQLRSGNLEESRKNLSMALELRPGDPTLLLDYGLLLNAENKPEDGKLHIELAMRYADQLGLNFPRRAEAEQILGKK